MKFLSFAIFGALFLGSAAGALTENDILAARAQRVRSMEQQLASLEERLERHLSGQEKIPSDRLSSLNKRIHQYEDQLAELSKVLTAEELAALVAQSQNEEL